MYFAWCRKDESDILIENMPTSLIYRDTDAALHMKKMLNASKLLH